MTPEPSSAEQIAAWQKEWVPPQPKKRSPLADLHRFLPQEAFIRFVCPSCGREFAMLPCYARARLKRSQTPCCSIPCGQRHRAAQRKAAQC